MGETRYRPRERLGIKSTHIELPAETTQKEVIDTVISLNNDESVSWYSDSMSSSSYLDEGSLTDLIDPMKRMSMDSTRQIWEE